VLSYIDLDVMPGTQYYYLVSAVNSAGVSAGSNEAVVNYVTVPAAPQDLKAQASDGMISLTWKAPSVNGGSAVTSYRIYRGLTSGGEEYLASSTAPGYDDTTASPGLIYHYRVSAVNAMGEGPASNEASISLPNAPTPPAAPTNLKATSGSGFVTLTWTPAADADAQSTTYWVYRMNFDTNQWELVAKISGVLYTDSNLVNGKVYAYAVVANNTVANSGMTPTVTATPTAPPAALTSLDAFVILVIIAVPLVLLIVWIRRKGGNGNT
jgi:fibronectin type 3 domain-containing protein